MPQVYDMGHGEEFFALKNPMASAGFEPANLGTKGQHATSRPPTQLCSNNSIIILGSSSSSSSSSSSNSSSSSSCSSSSSGNGSSGLVV